MYDIFFTDANEVPVPPEEVRIRTFNVKPRSDGVRVDVHIELTPFQRRPNLELELIDQVGKKMSSLSVVEAIDPKMDFTMHLRNKSQGKHQLVVQVFYSDIDPAKPLNGANTSAGEMLNKAKKLVDQRLESFNID
jgi:hypothetical protein